MFYNNGTIFQTTFGSDVNIPKLGENLAEVLNHIRKIYEFCNMKAEDYKKLIFETEDVSIIVLKLGEDSNIALFFKKEEDKELKLTAIRRYLNRIEDLIDMDANEILFQEILVKEEELKSLNNLTLNFEQELKEIDDKLDDPLIKESEVEKQKLLKRKQECSEEILKIQRDIEEKIKDVEILKKKVKNVGNQ
ncbi:MAG: hypothetical protein ACFFA8_08790 [Promethearchaeota archaeon]